MDWSPLILTLQLALITTLILLVISVPLAYWLAYSNSRVKPIIQTLVSMPLVLPPTVIGFYLLLVLSPNSALGSWLNHTFGIQLAFSFGGLVVGSVIYSLPFMVHPILTGFNSLSTNIIEASWTMGKSKITTLFKVMLPMMRSSVITGVVLTFAHTIGEFGVVLMIGGSIPGRTRVASVAIYDEVEALNYASANQYSIILFLITFAILLIVYLLNKGELHRAVR